MPTLSLIPRARRRRWEKSWRKCYARQPVWSGVCCFWTRGWEKCKKFVWYFLPREANSSSLSAIVRNLEIDFMMCDLQIFNLKIAHHRQLYSGHNSTSLSFWITSIRTLSDAIFNSKLWSHMSRPCNFIGWSRNRAQPDSHNCHKRWGICFARQKISNMFDIFLTASWGDFSPKFRRTREKNGWENCLARHFAQLSPNLCGGDYVNEMY